MKRFYFHPFNHRNAAEDGTSTVKKFLWSSLIIFALLAIQDRLNTDVERFKREQSSIRATSCN